MPGDVTPYYQDDLVTLYHGDSRDVTEWAAADLLVTDPPYGIGWRQGTDITGKGGYGHRGIVGDATVAVRDAILETWGDRPGLVFASPKSPPPPRVRQMLIWHKPPGLGVIGSVLPWRTDIELVYAVGTWPARPPGPVGPIPSSVIRGNVGGPRSYLNTGADRHPHAKPVSVMEELLAPCPPGVIADPFAGSGSTLVAARNLGRACIGVEYDREYCDLIVRRLAQGVLL